MVSSISKAITSCLELFRKICDTFGGSAAFCQDDVSAVAWTDELGRLRVWAANIGAHQTGQSSLEFRLRDASNIKTQIEHLLKDLLQALNDASDEQFCAGTEDAQLLIEPPDSVGDESLPSEMRQLYEDVVNIIDCLYQLSMVIRKPAQHDVLTKSYDVRVAAYEPHDRAHVRNKFVNADDIIVNRLGLANSRRREYLRYRERHHAKLGKGIEGTVASDLMSDTNATDYNNNDIDLGETASISGRSQSSYAHSLIEGGPITIPPLPKLGSEGKPFECPYCFFIIDTYDTLSWTQHIIRDLRPYICIVPVCRTPEKLYDSKREWFQHLITNHSIDNSKCPLCKSNQTSMRDLERHLGRHLQELALFVLPSRDTSGADETHEAYKSSDSGGSSIQDQVATDSKSENLSSQTHTSDKQRRNLYLTWKSFNPFSSKKTKNNIHLATEKSELPEPTGEKSLVSNSGEAQDIPIWQVARATSAAPGYFKPVRIDGPVRTTTGPANQGVSSFNLPRVPMPPPQQPESAPVRMPSRDKSPKVILIESEKPKKKHRSPSPQYPERQPRYRRRRDQSVIVVRQPSLSSDNNSPSPSILSRDYRQRPRSSSPTTRYEAEKRSTKEQERRQYTEKVAREEEKARKRASLLADYERLEKERVQERLEYEERRPVERARHRQQQEDFEIAQARKRQELEDIKILNARQRAERRREVEDRRRRDEHERLRLDEEERLERARRVNARGRPRGSTEERGERFLREAVRMENLRRFERDFSPPARRSHKTRDDDHGLRRRNSDTDRRERRSIPVD